MWRPWAGGACGAWAHVAIQSKQSAHAAACRVAGTSDAGAVDGMLGGGFGGPSQASERRRRRGGAAGGGRGAGAREGGDGRRLHGRVPRQLHCRRHDRPRAAGLSVAEHGEQSVEGVPHAGVQQRCVAVQAGACSSMSGNGGRLGWRVRAPAPGVTSDDRKHDDDVASCVSWVALESPGLRAECGTRRSPR